MARLAHAATSTRRVNAPAIAIPSRSMEMNRPAGTALSHSVWGDSPDLTWANAAAAGLIPASTPRRFNPAFIRPKNAIELSAWLVNRPLPGNA